MDALFFFTASDAAKVLCLDDNNPARLPLVVREENSPIF
jgi:hypothetical protein